MPADACRVPADDARGSKDAVPCDDGWLVGGRQMLCRTTADGLRWAGGYRAVNWRVDGLRRDGGCCVGGRQMLRRTTADGLQGGVARCCAVCCMICGASAGGAQRVEGWCAGSKRVVHGGPASCQQKALGDYI